MSERALRRVMVPLANHRSLLVAHCLALTVIGAAYPSIADENDSSDSAPVRSTARLSDAQAKALALKAHAEAAAMDGLPKFFYRIKSGNGDVTTMRDRPECSIEGLKEALDGPVAKADGDHQVVSWHQKGVTLAWDESHAYWGEGEREGGKFGKKGKDTWRRDQIWTKELAFDRIAADDQPTRFHYRLPKLLWDGRLTELAYFRVTPHHFWWASSDDHNDTISLVPPEEADFRFITREPFDHEICDVVESPSRAERLWIGRESGRLRGVLVLRYRGDGSEEPFFQHARVQKIAGARFNSQQEYVEWLRGKTISARQKIDIARAWCELHFGVFGPNELIRFRDYREVAPGVWIPFREDRAFTHRAEGNASHHKYIRLWVAVEEVSTGVDLAERVGSLSPREGEHINDNRFGVVINYQYKAGRAESELLELVDAERQKQIANDAFMAARRALLGSPAPELSGITWLNARKPPTWRDLHGKPVLLVLFDLKQQSFLPLIAPLLGFAKAYREEGLTFIGIHAQAPRDDVEKRLTEEHIDFPVLIDDGKTEERFGIGFSACILIGRDGKIVSVYKDSLAPPAEIEKLLEEKKPE